MRVWQYSDMGRKIVYICVAYLSQAYIYAFTAEIATSRYKLDTFKFFPTTNEQRWRGISLKGIDNL